jgi:Ca-activated chloride channel family protein
VQFDAPAPPAPPPALAPRPGRLLPQTVEEFLQRNQQKPGDLEVNRGKFADRDLQTAGDETSAAGLARKAARELKADCDAALGYLQKKDQNAVQAGKLGVDLSCQTACLRNQTRLDQAAVKCVCGRTCLEFGGVWIDEGYDAKMATVTVKAQSDAYFKLLERQPTIKDVLTLGNHLVWVAPSGTALIINAGAGKESLSDDDVDALFVAKK